MNMRTSSLTALALATALTASQVAAGDRWLIGLDGLSSHIEDNNDEDSISVDEKASGGALQIGYRFSPNFMLRIYGGTADHPTSDPKVDIRFGGGLFEGVYLYRDGQSLRPYMFGGVGGFGLESQQASLLYKAEGAGVSFGGGLHYLVSRRVSLHGSLRLEAVNWNTVSVTYTAPDGGELAVETPVEESGFASKVTFGVAFWL